MVAIILPQVVTEDRASGAQVIDGSLKFDDDKKQFLKRTFGSGGNSKTWTWSAWLKRDNFGADHRLFTRDSDANNQGGFKFIGDQLQFFSRVSGTFNINLHTAASFRDTGWYHMMVAVNTLVNTPSTDRVKIYVNGSLQTIDSSNNTYPSVNYATAINTNIEHIIGKYDAGDSQYMNGAMAQVYFIDGQALGPEFFGYTDPLTNTWRPRVKLKKTVNDGTNFTADVTNTGGTLNNVGRIFDGTIASDATIASGAATITYTPSTPIKYTDSVRVMGSGSPSAPYNARWQLNGGSNVSTVNANEFVTLDSGNGGGTITSIKLTVDSGGANWRAIEVDGVLMKANTVESVNFGTTGFYLPMDGNTPIGKDQSGNEKDWKPVNFGGSTSIEKATGAKPILNTLGGTVAQSGVFGSKENKYYTVTVASVDGGNRYHFDGVDRPNPTLIRGATYTFDQSDSSNGGGGTHPLRFATAADAAGSSQYTDGVATNGTPGQAGAYTKITVPHNAPNTLYYYCTNHGGMGSSTVQITDETKADKYASSLVLACPYAGSKEDISSEINCTVSNKGSDNYGSIQTIKDGAFYGGSRFFDGSNDNINYSSSSTLGFDGAFTIEMYATPSSSSNNSGPICSKGYYSANTGNWYFRFSVSDGGKMNFYSYQQTSSGQNNEFTNLGCTDTNKMHHIVCQRNSSNLMTFLLDGVIVGQASNVTRDLSDGASNGLSVGRIASGNSSNSAHSWYDGNISDLRIYKGIDKYDVSGKSTGDQVFIPASTEPDVIPDTPSGVGTKTQLTKITDGAVAFDGSGDVLSVSDHVDLRFGTGAFTIECYVWFNSITTSTYPSIFSKYTGGTASWIMRIKNNGKAVYYSAVGGGSNEESSAHPIAVKKWHHIAMVREGTGSNQAKMYVDGKLVVTATDGTDYTDTQTVTIGAQNASGNNALDGYMSNCRIVKGTALYTANFTPPHRTLTSVTNTKLLCCQSNTSTTAAAVIPTGSVTVTGDATATTLNPFTSDIKAIRGRESGYCKFNDHDKNSTASLHNGGLNWKTVNGNGVCRGTHAVSSGKWYFEFLYTEKPSGGGTGFGILSVGETKDFPGGANAPDGYLYYSEGGSFEKKYNDGTATDYGASFAPGHIIGVALDMDNGTIIFYNNGKSQGVAFTGISGTYAPAVTSGTGTGTAQCVANFGQKPFKFPPPDGYQALTSSSERSETVIARPEQYFSPFLYTGNGASSRNLTLPLDADFLWIKKRSATNSHQLVDTVRGDNSVLHTNANLRAKNPQTQFSGGGISSISGTTATLSSGTSNNDNVNANSSTLVGYTWKAGGAPTATNDNTSGAMDANSVSIDGVLQSAYTPSGSPTIYPKKMSIGTKQGFSIINYNGVGDGSTETIPHGLLEEPDFAIIKNLTTDSTEWAIYHRSGGAGATYRFANNHKESTSMFGSANPANGVITLKENSNRVNNTSQEYICYAWHNVPGLQRFGKYTGNSSTNFVNLGFRPAIVWVKRSVANSSSDTSTNNTAWTMMDDRRLAYNGLTPNHLYANFSAGEGYRGDGSGTSSLTDMTLEPMSNGFYLNGPASETNSSTGSFIYCAWAAQPSFNLYGAESNGR